MRGGQVDVLGVLAELGQLGEPGQGPDGSSTTDGMPRRARVVRDLSEQDALAGAESADHGNESGGLLDLGGVVGVEHDRAARTPRR